MSYGIMDQLVLEHRSELGRAAQQRDFRRGIAASRRPLVRRGRLTQQFGSLLIRLGSRLAATETRPARVGHLAR